MLTRLCPRTSRTLIAAALAASFTPLALAADELSSVVTMPATVVTASATRFDSLHAPGVSLSVINQDDIANSPAANLLDLLRGVAGIQVMPMTGGNAADGQVDLRGFGESAGANVVILVDGIRVSPVDSGRVGWSQLPRSAIERIEVLKGAGTVLYGDRASGGVINIITKRSTGPSASIAFTTGSFNHEELQVSLAGANEVGYASLHARGLRADGWRERSKQNLSSVAGEVGVYVPTGEVFLRYALYDEYVQSPGNLFKADYRHNPRQSLRLDDATQTRGHRVSAGTQLELSDSVFFEMELTEDRHNSDLRYYTTNAVGERVRLTHSVTPRLRVVHALGGLPSETVVGFDRFDSRVAMDLLPGFSQRVTQLSTGYYAQNTTQLTGPWSVTTGYRLQTVKQKAQQGEVPEWWLPAMSGKGEQRREALDVSLAYTQPAWSAYAKMGTTFRFANTDELFGFDVVNYRPFFAGNLLPQKGLTYQVGGAAQLGAVSLQGALYTMRLRNELGYSLYADGGSANVNLDPTRRTGIELEGSWAFAPAWQAAASYHYIDARFRRGAHAGNEIPMVAKQKATLSLSWDGAQVGRYTAFVNSVSSRGYALDFENRQGRVAGYATLDLAASWKPAPFEVTLRVNNVLDKRYATYAGYHEFQDTTYYTPAEGRAAALQLRYAFR